MLCVRQRGPINFMFQSFLQKASIINQRHHFMQRKFDYGKLLHRQTKQAIGCRCFVLYGSGQWSFTLKVAECFFIVLKDCYLAMIRRTHVDKQGFQTIAKVPHVSWPCKRVYIFSHTDQGHSLSCIGLLEDKRTPPASSCLKVAEEVMVPRCWWWRNKGCDYIFMRFMGQMQGHDPFLAH